MCRLIGHILPPVLPTKDALLEGLSGRVSAHTLSGPESISEAVQARAVQAAAGAEPGCRHLVPGQGWHCRPCVTLQTDARFPRYPSTSSASSFITEKNVMTVPGSPLCSRHPPPYFVSESSKEPQKVLHFTDWESGAQAGEQTPQLVSAINGP